MAKVTRIITYEGSEESIRKQLEKSLPIGVHHLMTTISVEEYSDWIPCESNLDAIAKIYRDAFDSSAKPADDTLWNAVKDFCRG